MKTRQRRSGVAIDYCEDSDDESRDRAAKPGSRKRPLEESNDDEPAIRDANAGGNKGGRKNFDWLDAFQFRCLFCQRLFFVHFLATQHVTKVHQTKPKFNRTHVQIQTRTHRCSICQEAVAKSFDAVDEHVQEEHGMTVQEYDEQYSGTKDFGLGEPGDYVASAAVQPAPVKVRSATAGHEYPEYDWMDKCVYKCLLCREKFSKQMIVMQHTKSAHQVNPAINKNYERSVTSFHQCYACRKRLMNDHSQICSHVTQFHRMTVEEYHDSYSKEPGFGVAGSKAPKRSRSKEKMAKNTDSSALLPKWVDQCEYKCNKCSKKFISACQVFGHMQNAHNLQRNLAGTYERTVTQWHRCLECGNAVMHDRVYIKQHLKRRHDRMNIVEYDQKHKAQLQGNTIASRDEVDPKTLASVRRDSGYKKPDWVDGCTYTCLDCRETFSRRKFMQDHARRVHKTTRKKMVEEGRCRYVRKYHTCLICDQKVVRDNGNIIEHLRFGHDMTIDTYKLKFDLAERCASEDELTVTEANEVPPWVQQCQYHCTICAKTLEKLCSIEGHCKVKHKTTYSKMSANGTVYRSVTKWHQCFICKARMVCENSPIYSHLQTHNMTTHEYHKKFCKKKGLDKDIKNALVDPPE